MAKARMNQVILIGNVGADPEVSYMRNGFAIAKLSVATNDGYFSGKDSKWIDVTTWHKVKQLGKDAENVGQVRKGDTVIIIGSKAVDTWDDREGNRKYFEYVKASIIAKVIALENMQREPSYPGPQHQQAPQQQYHTEFPDEDISF